jgi:hypothetical protein
MFKTEEEARRALNELNELIRSFNRNYGVTADISVFERASDKKSANRIFIDAFNGLLREMVEGEGASRNNNVTSLRAAFERQVVGPYRKYATDKASENEIDRVKRALPDVDAGLKADEWRRQTDKALDDIYWEKIDPTVNNYKKGSPRIRDMVADTKRILQSEGDLSQEDVHKIATYAAALKRANDSRLGIWKFFFFVRSNAEQREAENIAKMLNERMGDPNAYRNALKEITDPKGRIEALRGQIKVSQGLKLDFSVASDEKKKAKETEKRKEPEIKEEKIQIVVDDESDVSKSITEEKVPGNDRLYRLIGDKSFEAKIKDDIWKALNLKETRSIDKEEVAELLYRPLLESAKSMNEDHMNLAENGADVEALGEGLGDAATSMFTEVYLKLEDFHMGPEDRVVAAQRITDIMLNRLTVIGFERDAFGVYGQSYAVKNEDAAFEMLQMGENPLPEETSARILRSAKKQLASDEKERIDVLAASGEQKGSVVSARYEEPPHRTTFLNK